MKWILLLWNETEINFVQIHTCDKHIQGQRANWFITLTSTADEIKWPTWNSTCFYHRERNSTHWTAEYIPENFWMLWRDDTYLHKSCILFHLLLIWVNTQDLVHLIYSPLHIPDAFLYHDDVSCRCSQCQPVIPVLPCRTEESHINLCLTCITSYWCTCDPHGHAPHYFGAKILSHLEPAYSNMTIFTTAL